MKRRHFAMSPFCNGLQYEMALVCQGRTHHCNGCVPFKKAEEKKKKKINVKINKKLINQALNVSLFCTGEIQVLAKLVDINKRVFVLLSTKGR